MRVCVCVFSTLHESSSTWVSNCIMHLLMFCRISVKNNTKLHVARIVFSLGCTLKSDRREFKVDVEDDDTEQQLSLKAVRKVTVSS